MFSCFVLLMGSLFLGFWVYDSLDVCLFADGFCVDLVVFSCVACFRSVSVDPPCRPHRGLFIAPVLVAWLPKITGCGLLLVPIFQFMVPAASGWFSPVGAAGMSSNYLNAFNQPPGFEELDADVSPLVCKLHKALYGLRQAPKNWHDKLKDSLVRMGFVEPLAYVSLFVKYVNHCYTFVLVYVDNIIITGECKVDIERLIQCLQEDFSLKDLGSSKLVHDTGPLLSDAREYRSLVGALLYVCHTRPDIVFIVNKTAQYMHAPCESHMAAVKRILRYLAGTLNYGLSFLADEAGLKVVAFADADSGGDVGDRRSISGHAVFLGKYATAEVTKINALLVSLGVKQREELVIWCDNTSAIAMGMNLVHHAQSKHVDMDVHFIREKVVAKVLRVSYVPASYQVTDGFTKPLTKATLHMVEDGSRQIQYPDPMDQEICLQSSFEHSKEGSSTQPSFDFSEQSGRQDKQKSYPSNLIHPAFGLHPEATKAIIEEMPPLPPLPPMQWRIGRVQYGEKALFAHRPNQFVLDASLERGSFQDTKQSFDREHGNPYVVSVRLPTKREEQIPTEVAQVLPTKVEQFPAKVDEQPRHSLAVSEAEKVQTPNVIVQHGLAAPEGETARIEHDLLTSEGEKAWPSNTHALLQVAEEGNSNGNSPVKLPRPSSPLIDDVAAHDNSKMRKETEQKRPPIIPKVDERDSLLEQIRTKSFNLKPAVVLTGPRVQGPKTNIRIAAILEKANAIRQALAGSDEDSWSDS
ncbi:hypothetical protein F3Y22_tig00110050pilonHSYRG00115 [Hibiscus syriacus]|uniref:WH2 domain-containing protein n=1 Tax=Hibiscus syriacus TaxID=106335 RepID=A0A6A3BNB2_HIBSY|nr:hypothetical protein F3Y22_tig00110050pilonHSYRG00115 [Hibiscus syriacus]